MTEARTKPWYTSKTILANGVAVAASVAMLLGLDVPGDVQAEIVVLIIAGTNVVLRFITTKPVGS